MRIICAALLSAAVALPSLASEIPPVPDPTDAGASVPTLTVPSATESYKPFEDKPVGAWRELNSAVAPVKKNGMSGISGMSGMGHTKTPAESAKSHSAEKAVQGNEDGMAGMNHSNLSPRTGASKAGGTSMKQEMQMNHGGMDE